MRSGVLVVFVFMALVAIYAAAAVSTNIIITNYVVHTLITLSS